MSSYNTSSSLPASTHGAVSDSGQVFVVEIEGEQYRVNVHTETSAKYRAANAHKEQHSEPDVGRSVDQLAGIASVIGSMRAK